MNSPVVTKVTTDYSDDSFWRRFNEDVVVDPDTHKLLNLSQLKEQELVKLFDRSWAKVKRFRTRHYLKHGYLLNCVAILKRLYQMNLHKWGRDEGRSAQDLEFFEKYLKEGFNPSDRGKHR